MKYILSVLFFLVVFQSSFSQKPKYNDVNVDALILCNESLNENLSKQACVKYLEVFPKTSAQYEALFCKVESDLYMKDAKYTRVLFKVLEIVPEVTGHLLLDLCSNFSESFVLDIDRQHIKMVCMSYIYNYPEYFMNDYYKYDPEVRERIISYLTTYIEDFGSHSIYGKVLKKYEVLDREIYGLFKKASNQRH